MTKKEFDEITKSIHSDIKSVDTCLYEYYVDLIKYSAYADNGGVKVHTVICTEGRTYIDVIQYTFACIYNSIDKLVKYINDEVKYDKIGEAEIKQLILQNNPKITELNAKFLEYKNWEESITKKVQENTSVEKKENVDYIKSVIF